MQAAVNVKALEKQLQQKKDSDHIMAGILEEVRYVSQPALNNHVPLLDLLARRLCLGFLV